MRINLKVFRTKEQLSQGEIAEKVGYSRTAYTAIENGSREGKMEFWDTLQKAFDIPDADMWDLMKNEPKK